MKDRQGEKFMDIIDNENDHYEQEVDIKEVDIVESKLSDGNSCDSLMPKKRGRKPKKSIIAQEENLLGEYVDQL